MTKKMGKTSTLVATAVVAAGLGLGSAAAAIPVASAAPVAPVPLKPGHGNDQYCPPWCGDDPGRGHDHQWDDRGPGPGKGPDKGPWWANNPHPWWDDRNGPPPWGWGPPPPLQWNGGPLPPRVNYWGYDLPTVWDDGNRQWGIWLFGQWIPIFGVGVN